MVVNRRFLRFEYQISREKSSGCVLLMRILKREMAVLRGEAYKPPSLLPGYREHLFR